MLILNNVSASYAKKGDLILHDVSFKLPEGQIGVLLGPNGAGKSTLFQTLLGSLKCRSGEILLDGLAQKDAKGKQWSQKVAYVPQRIVSSGLSVEETVLLGKMPYFGFSPSPKEIEATEKVLDELGLLPLKDKPTNQLSGGELQKVAIGMALNQQPSLLLFDEPTSNLDVSNSVLFANLCKTLSQKKGISILIALHDLNMALDLGDRFYFLKEGRLLVEGDASSFNETNIRDTFGVDVSISVSGGDKHIHYHHNKENHHEN